MCVQKKNNIRYNKINLFGIFTYARVRNKKY